LVENAGKMENSVRSVPEGKCVVGRMGGTGMGSDRTCLIEGPLFNIYAYETGVV